MGHWVCTDCTTPYPEGPRCPNCASTRRTGDGTPGPALPRVQTACRNTACPAAGVPRRLWLQLAVPGVLQLPRLMCTGCGGELPVAWPAPHDEQEAAEPMPKITRNGGATNAAAPARESTPTGAAAPTSKPPEDEPPATTGTGTGPEQQDEGEEGGEQPSPGNSSSPSTAKRPTSTSKSSPRRRKPARTTESPSPKDRTGSSSAATTDGAPTDGTSAPD